MSMRARVYALRAAENGGWVLSEEDTFDRGRATPMYAFTTSDDLIAFLTKKLKPERDASDG